MLRHIRYALIVGGFVLLASLIYVRLPVGEVPTNRVAPGTSSSTSPIIQIADRIVKIDIADSPEERARGLSGRSGLAEDEGMLFIFDEDGRHAFWMKDMLFLIDIMWISRDGVIVHIEEHVEPETYPTAFSPRREARYVLELPAGFVERQGVRVGDVVRL